MAMAPRLFRPCNEIHADPFSDAYEEARRAVTEATSCLQAVELLRVLEHESNEVRQEADAVFDALPPDVNEGVLAALRNGFDRKIPMELWWEDTRDPSDLTITYSVADAGVRLRISFWAPNGRHFVA
jgi:hypothetical protein